MKKIIRKLGLLVCAVLLLFTNNINANQNCDTAINNMNIALELDASLRALNIILQNWDDNAFRYIGTGKGHGKFMEFVDHHKEKMGIATNAEGKFLEERSFFDQSIKHFILMRKYFIGAGGNDKKMQEIEDSLFDREISASEARGAMKYYIFRFLQKRQAVSVLLQKEVNIDANDEKYQQMFKEEKTRIEDTTETWIKKFIELNKSKGLPVSRDLAIDYFIHIKNHIAKFGEEQ